MMKMKQLFLIALSLCFCCIAAALEVSLEPVRRNINAGNFIQLKLSSDKAVTRIDYPAVTGAAWENAYSSSGMQNINGKVTYTRVLMLSPEKEGVITIPPFKVTCGSESAMTREVKVQVLPRDKAPEQAVKVEDVVKGTVTLAPASNHFWAGEEITLYCDLFVESKYSSQIRITYFPELLNTGNAIFATFNYRNGRVRFRMEGNPEEVVEEKRVFLRHRFTAQCRILTPGNFAPGAEMQIGILQQNSVPDDDFFGGFGSSFFSSTRTVPYKVRFTPAKSVEIKPLPPLPEKGESTALVGKWQITGALSSSSLRQGEVAELTLTFKGSGGAEQFRAPKVEFQDFRVYPPEVTRKKGIITAKYALIPLMPGEKVMHLYPCFFDPAGGKWVMVPLEFKGAVAKSAALPRSAPQNKVYQESAGKADPGKAEEKAPQTRLFYQKSTPGKAVELPLIYNNILWIILFGLGMPLAAVGIELYFRRREKESNSPELKKKKALKKAMAEAAKEFRAHGDTPEFRSKFIPLLGEAMGLSAGATAGEIAAKVDDTELCRYFSEIESASFLPGGGKAITLDRKGTDALLKLMKKYMLWGLCCFALTLQSGEINKEFNQGEFASAARRYAALAVQGELYRPQMLYNYGNACYMMNDLPEARRALNLALLLAPEDGEIRANLHLVNTRLFENTPAENSFSAMLKEFRDHLRPDRYLLLAAFCWGMIWILWSFRRQTGKNLFYSCGGTALFLALLFVFSCCTQMKENYSPDRIIVTASKVELRTLPGKTSGTIDSTLTGGGEGELLRKDLSGYCRIRINGRDGWVPENAIKRAFPGSLF